MRFAERPIAAKCRLLLRQDAKLSEQPARPTHALEWGFFVPVDSFSPHIVSQLKGDTGFCPLPSGPSAQILLCVWRC